MRIFPFVAVLAVVAATAAGCGSSGEEPDPKGAGVMIERHFQDEFAGRFGPTWDDLHPGHQALITRERFEQCFRLLKNKAKLASFVVTGISDDPIDIEGIPEKSSQAVSWRFTVRVGTRVASDKGVSHGVFAEGDWHWVLSAAAVEQVKDGRCPTG